MSTAPASSKAAELFRAPVPLSRYFLFFSVALAGCAGDLLTKHWIFSRLGYVEVQQGDPRPPSWLIDGIFGFETSVNEGALFGIGQGMVVLFSLLSIAAAVGIVYWLFVARAAHDWLLTTALASVTAGILGNLYDRLGIPGLTWAAANRNGHVAGTPVLAVRDWLHFKIDAWGFDWPIFNLADCMLVCGATLLVLHAFVDTYRERAVSNSNNTANGA